MHNIRKNVLLEESVQDGYTHPVKNRRYLQRSCINAVLSEGLEELIREVQLNRQATGRGREGCPATSQAANT